MDEERAISEAEKMTNRRIIEKRIAEHKKFFESAVYRRIVWNEDDEIEGYEEDDLTY